MLPMPIESNSATASPTPVCVATEDQTAIAVRTSCGAQADTVPSGSQMVRTATVAGVPDPGPRQDGDDKTDGGIGADDYDLLLFCSESDPDFGAAGRAKGLAISPEGEITALPCEQIEPTIKQSVDEVGALKRELDQLRQLAAELTREYRTIEQTLHEADLRSAAVLEAVGDIGKRLGSLDVLVDIHSNTGQRFADVNVLADDLMRRVEALEGHRNTIDHALAEANRLAEIMSAMDTQIATLKKPDRLVVRTWRMLGRLRSRVTDRSAQVPAQNARADTLMSASRNTHWRRGPHRRYLRVVIGGLAVFALSGILTRSRGNARQIGSDSRAQARATLNATGLVWTGMLPSSAQPQMQTAKIVTSPSFSKALPRDPVRRQGFSGTLAIESNPGGAAVFIDSQHVGNTPLQLSRWRAGSHAVWIERTGYQRWTAAVLVPANKLTQIRATLHPDLASP
jgi:hypothetical protein